MNISTILGKLEQCIDAAKLARKALKNNMDGDALDAAREALSLATDAVALFDEPVKEIKS